MSKRGSLKHQIIMEMDKMQCYGQSKHEAQMREKERCRAEGISWNPARVRGIFSIKTYDKYKDINIKFGQWAKENHGVRSFEELKERRNELAKEYIERSVDRGDSPWTTRLTASAIGKLFEVSYTEFGAKMPKRDRESITRSREERFHDKEFSREKNSHLTRFGEGTGLRKEELSLVRPEQIREREDGRVYITFEKERFGSQTKGGRDREVTVRKGYESHVLECRDKAISEGREKVFNNIPNRLDEHAFRHEYAQGLYQELLQEKYERGEETKEWYRLRDGSGDKYDKEILREVSNNLGHGDQRCHTIVHHYIK